MLDAAVLLHPLNALLRREAWARERLQPFSGKVFAIRVGAAPALQAQIDTEGLLQPASVEAALRIGVPLDALPGLLLGKSEALRALGLEGDMELAEALRFLMLNLRWDVEEDLARVLGDVAAHRIAGGARDLHSWLREAAQRFGENAAHYLRDESGALASNAAINAFIADVAALRDDVARFEARLRRAEGR